MSPAFDQWTKRRSPEGQRYDLAILRLWAAGLNHSEIGRAVPCNRETVARLLRIAGVDAVGIVQPSNCRAVMLRRDFDRCGASRRWLRDQTEARVER